MGQGPVSLCALHVGVMVAPRGSILLLLGLCVSGFCVWPQSLWAQAEEVCPQALETAEKQYREAAHDEAIRLVTACLNQDEVPPEHAVAAYRLLALIHLKRDQLNEARSAVVNLLGVNPEYEADKVENPPAYVSLVSVVKQDLESGRAATGEAVEQETPFFRRTSTWVTLGSIVISSGVATYFTVGTGGGGEEPPPSDPSSLPIPPSTPE